ncbi:hypothetical protein Ancab_010957 [Ancistrocladus abbreviatus]
MEDWMSAIFSNEMSTIKFTVKSIELLRFTAALIDLIWMCRTRWCSTLYLRLSNQYDLLNRNSGSYDSSYLACIDVDSFFNVKGEQVKLSKATDLILAESEADLVAMEMLVDSGISKGLILGDCQQVIHCMEGQSVLPWKIAHTIADIHHLKSIVPMISFAAYMRRSFNIAAHNLAQRACHCKFKHEVSLVSLPLDVV